MLIFIIHSQPDYHILYNLKSFFGIGIAQHGNDDWGVSNEWWNILGYWNISAPYVIVLLLLYGCIYSETKTFHLQRPLDKLIKKLVNKTLKNINLFPHNKNSKTMNIT